MANTKASVTAFGQKRGCGGFGKLLSAANANNAENSGVRCANTNNRCANTNANYGFPLIPFSFFGLTLFREWRANKFQNPTKTMPLKSSHAPALVGHGRWQKNMEIVKCE